MIIWPSGRQLPSIFTFNFCAFFFHFFTFTDQLENVRVENRDHLAGWQAVAINYHESPLGTGSGVKHWGTLLSQIPFDLIDFYPDDIHALIFLFGWYCDISKICLCWNLPMIQDLLWFKILKFTHDSIFSCYVGLTMEWFHWDLPSNSIFQLHCQPIII